MFCSSFHEEWNSLFSNNNCLYKVFIFYEALEPKHFLSSSMSCSSSSGGLKVSPSPQGLATQRFIWNCLMHYLSNNQGSEFILQIIVAFVALMAEISQSSEPLTGCAFAGNNNNSVCKVQWCVRALQTRQKILKLAEEAPYSYATPINQLCFFPELQFSYI